MLEAIVAGFCLGTPIVLGLLATLRKGGKGQAEQEASQIPQGNGAERNWRQHAKT